jgi:hypothetical protein
VRRQVSGEKASGRVRRLHYIITEKKNRVISEPVKELLGAVANTGRAARPSGADRSLRAATIKATPAASRCSHASHSFTGSSPPLSYSCLGARRSTRSSSSRLPLRCPAGRSRPWIRKSPFVFRWFFLLLTSTSFALGQARPGHRFRRVRSCARGLGLGVVCRFGAAGRVGFSGRSIDEAAILVFDEFALSSCACL